MSPFIRIQPTLDSPALRAFVERLPEAFAHGEGDLIFNGRNVIRRFEVEGVALVVKHYRRPNIFQKIAGIFSRRYKGQKAFLNATKLMEAGFSTPAPIAVLELRNALGATVDAYFACAPCDLPPINPLITPDGHPSLEAHESFLEQLTSFIASFHQRGIMHGDLNVSNIYYTLSPKGQYHFTLIDINRMSFRKDGQPLSRRRSLKDLMRITSVIEMQMRIAIKYIQLRGWDLLPALREEMDYKQKLNNHFARKAKWKKMRKK